MHASLREGVLLASPPARSARLTSSYPGHRTTGEILCILSGGGLAFAGLLLGSYRGLALAALGGFLLYRGLARPLREGAVPEYHVQFPDSALPHDEPKQTSRAVYTPASTVTVSQMVAVSRPCEHPHTDRRVPSTAPLTATEHAAAQVRAYFYALQRGGGQLPPYHPEQAAADFCRAAGELIRQRADDASKHLSKNP